MIARTKLKEIAEEIGIQSDEHTSYFDRKTGEVLMVSDNEMRVAEENISLEDYPEWQHEMIAMAKLVVNDAEGRYLPIPSKWDFHEYKVMEKFCWSRDDEEQSENLLDAIQGRGAFRMFKDRIHRLGIQNDWYRFRDEALEVLASDWAEENGIELTD